MNVTRPLFQNYTCQDFKNGVPCPCPSGNSDIAGLGVILVFYLTNICIAGLATTCYFVDERRIRRISDAQQPLRTEGFERLLADERERLAFDWGEKVFRKYGKSKSGVIRIWMLRTVLSLCDQAWLLGLGLIVLQVIGVSRGTSTYYDFRILSASIETCCVAQFFGAAILPPILIGREIELSEFFDDLKVTDPSIYDKIIEQSKSNTGAIRRVLKMLSTAFRIANEETKSAIEGVPINKETTSRSSSSTTLIRAISLTLLLLYPAIAHFLGFPLSKSDGNSGCPAKCVRTPRAREWMFGSEQFVYVVTIIRVLPVYVLQMISPSTARSLALRTHLLAVLITYTCSRSIQMLLSGIEDSISRAGDKAQMIARLIIYFAGLCFEILPVAAVAFLCRMASGHLQIVSPFLNIYLVLIVGPYWKGGKIVMGLWMLNPVMTFIIHGREYAAQDLIGCAPIQGTNSWSDGQILPLILLIIPIFLTFQAYSDANEESRTRQSSEDDDVILLEVPAIKGICTKILDMTKKKRKTLRYHYFEPFTSLQIWLIGHALQRFLRFDIVSKPEEPPQNASSDGPVSMQNASLELQESPQNASSEPQAPSASSEEARSHSRGQALLNPGTPLFDPHTRRESAFFYSLSLALVIYFAFTVKEQVDDFRSGNYKHQGNTTIGL